MPLLVLSGRGGRSKVLPFVSVAGTASERSLPSGTKKKDSNGRKKNRSTNGTIKNRIKTPYFVKRLVNRSICDKIVERFMTIKKKIEIIDKLSKKLETWQIKDLKPYDRKSRTHLEEQVIQIAESIKKFGFTNPMFLDS
jgi:hypothetical protein